MAALVGDLATDNDAAAPGPLRRPGAADHHRHRLPPGRRDAERRPWRAGTLRDLDFLFVENVGNLVCPASYDLGEDLRVVLLSVTEGEDKPLKYPTIFNGADLAILTKIDLAEAVELRPRRGPQEPPGGAAGDRRAGDLEPHRSGDGGVAGAAAGAEEPLTTD